MYSFLNPFWFLLLMPLLVLVVFLYLKGGKKIKFLPFDDIKSIYKNDSLTYKLYFILIFLIFFVFTVILSNPVLKNEKEVITKNGIDIEIVLDVSYSMNAKDLKPNRLDVAKNVIKNYISKLKTDRVGIVVFAGKPFTSLPLNFDYNIISKIIDKISVSSISQNNYYMQGTAIGDALILASDSFSKEEDREKVIILLTDGESNKGLDPDLALDYIKTKKKGLKIYTIGIGGLEPTSVEVTDSFGRIIRAPVSGIDEKALKKLSNETSGKYFRATDSETLEDIFNTIGKLEKKDLEVKTIQIVKEKNILFVYLLIFLMLSYIIFKYKKGV